MTSTVIDGGREIEVFSRHCVETTSSEWPGKRSTSHTSHLEDRGSLNGMRQCLRSDFGHLDVDAAADHVRDERFAQLL